MKNNPSLVAVICGLLAAVLFLGAFSFGPFGLILSNFTALPMFVAVLGFGTQAGALAAAVAAVTIAVMGGIFSAFGLVVTTIGPAVWIGYLVGLSRDDTGAVEWYPLSSLFFRIALICSATALFAGWMSGFSYEMATEYFSNTLTQVVEFQAKSNGAPALFTAAEISDRAGLMARLTPIIVPSWLLILLCYNLHLGTRFARKQGWMLRPKDDLPATIALPSTATGIMGLAVAGSFLPAPLGLMATSVAGALGAAFMVVGLATVHFLSRGISGRTVLLILTYVTLLLLPHILAPVLALLGIAETIFKLRARFTTGPSPTS